MLNDMCPTKPTKNEKLVKACPKRYRKPTSCPCCSSARSVCIRALQRHNNPKLIKKKLHFTSKETVARLKISRAHYQHAASDEHVPWCKYICGLENLSICTYCHIILPGDDLPILRLHALADRHKLRRKLQEHTSQDTKKSVLAPSIFLNLNHFNGSIKEQLLTGKQVLNIKKERRQGTSKQAPKVTGMSQEVLSSAMNCFVPLSPLHVQDFSQVKEWKPDQPVKPSSSCKLWSETVDPDAEVFNCFKENPSRFSWIKHWGACTLKGDSSHFPEPSKENYMSSLGLFPKGAAIKMAKDKGSRECESLDVDEEMAPAESESLTSTCTTSDPSEDKRESSLKSTRKTGHGMNLRKLYNKNTKVKFNLACTSKSLYSIDLTSPLGFLVIKHLRRDAFLNILSDIERFCLANLGGEALSVLSLRQRRFMFRTTFQESTVLKHCHQYKFNKEQKKEFMKYVETGLNKQSRTLLKLLKPCFVDVTRLSKKDISKFTRPRCSVVLRRLTASKILYWSQTKTRELPAARHPHGFELTLPGVANVLSLQTQPNICGGVLSRSSISEPKKAAAAPSNRGLQTSLSQTEVENMPIPSSLPDCVPPSPRKRTLSVHIQGGGFPQPIIYLPDITNLNQENSYFGDKNKSNVFSKADQWTKIQTDSLNIDTLIRSSNVSRSFTSLPCVDTKNVDYYNSVMKLCHTPGHICTIPGHTHTPEHTVRRSRRQGLGHSPGHIPGYATGLTQDDTIGHFQKHTVGHAQSLTPGYNPGHIPGSTPGQAGLLSRRGLPEVSIRRATEGAMILPLSNDESKPQPNYRFPTVTRFLGTFKMFFSE